MPIPYNNDGAQEHLWSLNFAVFPSILLTYKKKLEHLEILLPEPGNDPGLSGWEASDLSSMLWPLADNYIYFGFFIPIYLGFFLLWREIQTS